LTTQNKTLHFSKLVYVYNYNVWRNTTASAWEHFDSVHIYLWTRHSDFITLEREKGERTFHE